MGAVGVVSDGVIVVADRGRRGGLEDGVEMTLLLLMNDMQTMSLLMMRGDIAGTIRVTVLDDVEGMIMLRCRTT